MYTMENYIWGLVAYVLGVLLITPLLWRITRSLPWHPVKAFIRILVLVILLTPMIVDRQQNFLAPAWVVGVFELIQPQDGRNPEDVLTPIILSFVLIYLLDLAVWQLFRRRRAGAGSPATATETESTARASSH